MMFKKNHCTEWSVLKPVLETYLNCVNIRKGQFEPLGE